MAKWVSDDTEKVVNVEWSFNTYHIALHFRGKNFRDYLDPNGIMKKIFMNI